MRWEASSIKTGFALASVKVCKTCRRQKTYQLRLPSQHISRRCSSTLSLLDRFSQSKRFHSLSSRIRYLCLTSLCLSSNARLCFWATWRTSCQLAIPNQSRAYSKNSSLSESKTHLICVHKSTGIKPSTLIQFDLKLWLKRIKRPQCVSADKLSKISASQTKLSALLPVQLSV